ncbi:Bifunctional uridylyltransferase/uridylyl-removing enzyme [compost metagenome]
MDASLLSPHLLPDDQLTRDNCKEYLSRFLVWLHERFDAGDNIIELVATRSEYMDALLTRLWHKFGFDKTSLTLIAVGGYGRGELHPHSDIDLLILYEGDELDEVGANCTPTPTSTCSSSMKGTSWTRCWGCASASSSPCCGISSWRSGNRCAT